MSATIAAVVAGTVPLPAQANAAHKMTAVERAVALCETGLNWRHHSVGRREYEGAFGFLHSSWVAFRPKGAPLHAYQATPAQQIRAMRNIRARFGWSGWGCFVNGGYRSHL